MRKILVMAMLIGAFWARDAAALKAHRVDFGTSGTYDGQVYITRDTTGSLTFRDATVSTAVTLSELVGDEGPGDHGLLTGLGDDDHSQYLNASRHQSGHSATFNSALPTFVDVNGNMTLGDHLNDADIHLHSQGDEMISGDWQFSGTPEMRSNLRLSNAGGAGTARVIFEDGAQDAEVKWNAAAQRFEINRDLQGQDAALSELTAENVNLSGTLDGESGAARSGVIENFAEIEGIYPPNLLDSSANENVSGQWSFSDRATFTRLRIPRDEVIPDSGNVEGDIYFDTDDYILAVYSKGSWIVINEFAEHFAGYPTLDWLSSDSDRGTRASIHYQVQVANGLSDFNAGTFDLDVSSTESVSHFYVSDGIHIDPFPAGGLSSIDAGKRVFYKLPTTLNVSVHYYVRVIAWDGPTSSTAALFLR